MTKNNISVAEALKRLESGQTLSGFSIDFERIKIEALDVMKLSKAGVNVPEEAIFYDDDDIAPDEAFEGNWQRIDYDPIQELDSQTQTEVTIALRKEVRQWIAEEHIHLNRLIEILIDGFYQSQKVAKEK
ncbi:MAG: hypothetical protein IPN20_00380 [Haliscomenobacter sp.]|jgi:hypothetical protein|nr:hypothetical protein [Haliscomenobacter sp.]MBK8880342.1 hypothetical protein [Haliscomenobacter sp.]